MTKPARVALLWAMLSVLPGGVAATDQSIASVAEHFESPPVSSRPRVWWHWMNGNVTEEGIRQDLDWMHRVGLGGVHVFDAALDTPLVVAQPAHFMASRWKQAIRLSATLAGQLGLEFGIASSPGFSESGAPWVEPIQAMKKLVWAETAIEGGSLFSGKVAEPPHTVGPFQDVPVDRSGKSFGGPPPLHTVPPLYRDVALVAYRLPSSDRTMDEMRPAVTSGAGAVDTTFLRDGRFEQAIDLPFDKGGSAAWLRVDFGIPRRVYSMSLGLQRTGSPSTANEVGAELQASDDGVTFRHVASAYDPADYPLGVPPPPQETVTFPPMTARYLRLIFPAPTGVSDSTSSEATQGLRISELALRLSPWTDHFEQKAGYFLSDGVREHPTPATYPDEVVRRSDLIDLSGQMRPDGTLTWHVPPGRWALLRIGYSLLGTTNHPAPPEGTGLEVDKLDGTAVRHYIKTYLDQYESIVGARLMGSHGIRSVVNDSYELGTQNWTPRLPQEFLRRRGYDLASWYPALTGRIVDSAEATDRFLWDFRRTLGELFAENHYDQIDAVLHARGLLHYTESHEASRMFVGDGMDVKRNTDVPMGAMWLPGFAIRSQEAGDADLRESASVAHIYGQKLVAAESMTVFGAPGVAYALAPADLRATADRELVDGVNLFVIHTSVHQPLSKLGPGLTLGQFGQWFTRKETWAEQATPWISYLARCSYLLQQGQSVADIVYFYGQDSNITALYAHALPRIPEGYEFDFASAQALKMLSVKDYELTTKSGMHYRALVLDARATRMSLDVLKRIATLVSDGATVIGAKPSATPSLGDDSAEFHTLADAVWGLGTTHTHRYGRGHVLATTSAAAVPEMGLSPDFTYIKPAPDSRIAFIHRQLPDGDVYFLNNQRARKERIEGAFRVANRVPEFWHADTGLIEAAPYRVQGQRTVIPLTFDPNESVFVVFRGTPSSTGRVAEPLRHERLGATDHDWHVTFPLQRGAVRQVTMSHLQSWTSETDDAVKYFSGTAEYQTQLLVLEKWLREDKGIELDLGSVKNVAEIIVNGKGAGIVWKPPFRVDITHWLRSGVNQVTVRVTNSWANHLIGDKSGRTDWAAFTDYNPYSASSPLLESGLLGPVLLLTTERARSH